MKFRLVAVDVNVFEIHGEMLISNPVVEKKVIKGGWFTPDQVVNVEQTKFERKYVPIMFDPSGSYYDRQKDGWHRHDKWFKKGTKDECKAVIDRHLAFRQRMTDAAKAKQDFIASNPPEEYP